MTASNLPHEKKRHTILDALATKHNNTVIDNYLKMARQTERMTNASAQEPQRYNKFTLVLAVASNEALFILPHFFLQSLQVNSTIYTEVVNTMVKPWIKLMVLHIPHGLCSHWFM